MSVVPETVRTPRIPTAITSVIPSCRRRSRRKKFMRTVPGGDLLAQGVPQDDVVNKTPGLPSLVRVYVHLEVDVQKRPRRRTVGRIGESVAVRGGDVVRNHDGRAVRGAPYAVPVGRDEARVVDDRERCPAGRWTLRRQRDGDGRDCGVRRRRDAAGAVQLTPHPVERKPGVLLRV